MKFVVSVGEGALVEELALAEQLPVPAHLCLVFDLVGLYKFVSLEIRVEVLLRLL
jgi:hypothetical protein